MKILPLTPDLTFFFFFFCNAVYGEEGWGQGTGVGTHGASAMGQGCSTSGQRVACSQHQVRPSHLFDPALASVYELDFRCHDLIFDIGWLLFFLFELGQAFAPCSTCVGEVSSQVVGTQCAPHHAPWYRRCPKAQGAAPKV